MTTLRQRLKDALAAFIIWEDLTAQVDEVKATFVVLVDGNKTAFNSTRAFVLVGGVQWEATFNGAAGTFTLPVVPTAEDLNGGTLRFGGLKL